MSAKAKLRAWLERRLGRFYEGPEAPSRYQDEAEHFVEVLPGATTADWVGFAVRLAEVAYTEGYVRGLEHAERTRSGGIPDPVEAARIGAEARSRDEEAARKRFQNPGDPWAGLSPEHRLNALRGLGVATGAIGDDDDEGAGGG